MRMFTDKTVGGKKKLQVFLEKLKSEQDAKCEFGIIGF